MSKTIEGVPESITREQYLDLFRALGIDPKELVSLTFVADGIHAVVFALNDQGRRIVGMNIKPNGGYAKHTIYIPIEGEVAR